MYGLGIPILPIYVPHVYALLRFCGQCWHLSDLHCLFCYDDDELHLTFGDRESLLQIWQKENREFIRASTYIIYIHVYRECDYGKCSYSVTNIYKIYIARVWIFLSDSSCGSISGCQLGL